MKKFFSETLTLHSTSLLDAMSEYSFGAYATMCVQIEGRSLGIDYERFKSVGRQACAEIVAAVLLEALAMLNANVSYIFQPRRVPIPHIPTPKMKEWRESGNAGMFTEEEMYDDFCRHLPENALIEGAIKWYSSQFTSELIRIDAAKDGDWQFVGAYIDKESLTRQLLTGVVIIPLLEYTDVEFIGDAETLDDLRPLLATHPYGYFMQGDAMVLYESAASFILPREDMHDDLNDWVELYAVNENVVEELKKL